jgi:hypothetical protein
MSAPSRVDPAARILDIRTYRLVAAARPEFDRILREEALPMLARFGIPVVAFGPSIADDDGYVLIRSFESASERESKLGAFYGSDEWRERFDERVGTLIGDYQVVALACGPSRFGEA